MKKYNTILLDLDGTLTNPKEGITKCVQYALKKLEQPIPAVDELEWVIGPPLKDSFAIILQTKDQAEIDNAISLYRERYATIGIYECYLYNGIKELLIKLHQLNYQLVLATSKAVVYAHQLLEHYELSDMFELIVGSNLDGSLSDKTEIIAHIINHLPKTKKEEMVMIGDRFYDIVGAKNNGIDCIGVTYGYGSLPEIVEAAPTFIADSVISLASHFSISL